VLTSARYLYNAAFRSVLAVLATILAVAGCWTLTNNVRTLAVSFVWHKVPAFPSWIINLCMLEPTNSSVKYCAKRRYHRLQPRGTSALT